MKRCIIGIDEVGRGSLAGPVIAVASQIIDDSFTVQDSKKYPNEQSRVHAFHIVQKCVKYSVGHVTVQEIDHYNIHRASLIAMQRAVYSFPFDTKCDYEILVDGNTPIQIHKPFKVRAIVKGDQKEKCISSSSVIAKVIRDNIMNNLCSVFPQYGFSKHKGYGTKYHKQAILSHGITCYHRRTFNPIKNSLLLCCNA
ncbi:MAG: ribonuclease [Candidatus Xenolissoclinum pacificiensis L6]|uniref:Ribonuclease n=1 Tax=Candidatus Xenolissoclinum pacificiensis L6 TaxID=1401685 RepID=W2V1D1_9RICK|nr:MAG: ribonuclease [Candidatus Xenolissoclinum pacificiensis L6]